MEWKKIKNKKRFSSLLRQVAEQDLHWSSLMNCAVGRLCSLDGDDMNLNLKEVPAGTMLTDKNNVKSFRCSGPKKIFDETNLVTKNGKTLWCLSESHRSIERLNKRYGLTAGYIRAIEMTNDSNIIMRLAKKDLFPPGNLYKNKNYMRNYIIEIANLLDEYIQNKNKLCKHKPSSVNISVPYSWF